MKEKNITPILSEELGRECTYRIFNSESVSDKIEQLKQQLADKQAEVEELKYKLNNSENYHCPRFLSNDSGYISCQVKEHNWKSYELILKERDALIVEARIYMKECYEDFKYRHDGNIGDWLEKVKDLNVDSTD